jgi:hypothetical protein
MWRAGNTGPASAIPTPIPRLFYNVWAYLSEGWIIDERLAFTLEKVRSGSGTVVPLPFRSVRYSLPELTLGLLQRSARKRHFEISEAIGAVRDEDEISTTRAERIQKAGSQFAGGVGASQWTEMGTCL